MYVFRACYACPSPQTELTGDPADMALAVEDALGLGLHACVGAVLFERVHIVAHPVGSADAFTLHLEVRSPDARTRIRRASQAEAQHGIEAIVQRLLRELFGSVLMETAELVYERCDAAWGEAAPARVRTRSRRR